jgi:hypothetical protein
MKLLVERHYQTFLAPTSVLYQKKVLPYHSDHKTS